MQEKTMNPFTVDFGREPKEMIPRTRMMGELMESFTADHPSSHVYIVTGVRGSGKTVFMTEMCKELQQDPDWVVIELNPERDLLQGLASKLSEEKKLKGIFNAASINLSWFGIVLMIPQTVPRLLNHPVTEQINSLPSAAPGAISLPLALLNHPSKWQIV